MDKKGIEGGSRIVGPQWRSAVEWDMYGAVDMDCETVVGDDVFARARFIDVGHEGFDGGDAIADTRLIDMGCETADEGKVFVSVVMHPPVASA